MAFTCALGYQAQAATAVDTDATVTITAKLDSKDNSVLAQNYEGNVTVNLYKIATLDKTGKASVTDNFSKAAIDLSVLDDSPSVEDVQENIVEPALAALENLSGTADSSDCETITVTIADGSGSGSVKIEKGAGIYLYVPETVEDDRYEYSFTSYIVYAPCNNYITYGSGSDEWDYDVTITLKSSAEHRYGYLDIAKTLETYNESLGAASFVYQVEAVLDGKTVFSNVYSMEFTGAGNQVISIADENDMPIIPAGATVTVTEVYSGASYQMTASSYTHNVVKEGAGELVSEITDPIIVADETLVANFTNYYDEELQVGGISIVNNFELNENGEYEYTGNNISSTEGGNE